MNGHMRAIVKDRRKADQLIRDIEKSGHLIQREVRLETMIFSARQLSLQMDAKKMRTREKELKKEVKKKEKEIDRLTGLILKKSIEFEGRARRDPKRRSCARRRPSKSRQTRSTSC